MLLSYNCWFFFCFRDFNLEQIPTEELLSSPENIEAVDLMLNLSPNSRDEAFGMEYKFVLSSPDAYLNLSHLDKLPIVEEMITDWNFDVQLNSESAGKTSWMYSPKLNKVFVKISTHLNVYPKYDVIDSQQQLFVRAMIVYTCANDLAEPVKKCPNHRQSTHNNPEHILRCLSEETIYYGVDTGKLFKDKLAVVIPMSAIASNEPLKLQFTCQNSCSGGMNRKATSIVFTLENFHREILGRKIMNFKVCSCPKRDKDKDEDGVLKTMPKKRKSENTAPSTSKKVATTVTIVKQELDTTLSMPSELSLPSDLQSLNSGLLGFKREEPIDVKIIMPNSEMAREVLKFAYGNIAGEMFRTGDNKYQPYLTNIAKQIGK